MRPTVIVLCSAVLLASGCAQQATRSSAPATTPTTRPVALDGCVQPSSAQLIDLGGGNQAAVLGTGRLGVVLSNQSDQNLCGWLPFAKTLATRGFRALVYDYDTAADPAGNLVKAAAKLRQLGVRTVLLAGASQCAKASLMAAPATSPPVAGVVSPVGRAHRPGTGRAAVRRQAHRPGPAGATGMVRPRRPTALCGGHQGVLAAPGGRGC